MIPIKSQAHYHNEAFSNVDFNHARISASEFHKCRFQHCSFAEVEFDRCRFSQSHFENCDLSLMRVKDSVFQGNNFEGSKILGVNWTIADWSANLLGDPLSFEKCSINHSTFIGLQLPGVKIIACVANGVDFREADLEGSNLRGTDFSESLFVGTNLKDADLRGASNYVIDPTKNEIRGAKFSLPEAMSLLFSMEIKLSDLNGSV